MARPRRWLPNSGQNGRVDENAEEPPPEAYGRFSDTERHRVLHAWGKEQLNRSSRGHRARAILTSL